AASPIRRNPAPPNVASGWKARGGGLPLRRLARRRGAVVVAGPATRTGGRERLAVHDGVGLRGLARAPRRAEGEGDGGGARGLRRTPLLLDRRLERIRRRGRGRRPGAVRARVGRPARLRG